MRCVPTVVLRADLTAREALAELSGVPVGTPAVIIRALPARAAYYVFDVGSLRLRLSRAESPEGSLESVLALAEWGEGAVARLDSSAPAGTVALEGRRVVGVLMDDDPYLTRGSPDPASPAPGRAPDAAPPPAACPEPGSAPPAPPGPTRRAAAPRRIFRAYPASTAPEQVSAEAEFELRVGFSAEAPSATAMPVLVRMPAPQPERTTDVSFIVQVAGFGFRFPDGMRRTVTVGPDDPMREHAVFTVIADPVPFPASRIIEVSYEHQGLLVGQTWVEILIVPAGPSQADSTRIAPTGGTGLIDPAEIGAGPHLTVDILDRDGGSDLQWVFHCRYGDIPRPGAVCTRLPTGSARSFAVQLMDQLPVVERGAWLVATVRGVGEEIADSFPPQFWPLLEGTWRRALEQGEQPRLLINTAEPWIPWELAFIDDGRFADPGILPPADAGRALGQLWDVGRWTPPTRFQTGGSLPASPPATEIALDSMAVVIGDYPDDDPAGLLPFAVEEGRAIATRYDALPLQVCGDDVLLLMRDALVWRGERFRPTGVHFACHGEVEVDGPQFTGLVLAGSRRLERLAVKGFTLVESTRPFVFLNACEVGTAGPTLNELGGLAGAFLIEGARGFVAPLWKVSDVEAAQIANDFYRLTLDEQRTVGEALRIIRQSWSTDTMTSSTALSYVFYGSPDLRLTRSAPCPR